MCLEEAEHLADGRQLDLLAVLHESRKEGKTFGDLGAQLRKPSFSFLSFPFVSFFVTFYILECFE